MFKRLKLWWALKRVPRYSIVRFEPSDTIVMQSETEWIEHTECQRLRCSLQHAFPDNKVMVIGDPAIKLAILAKQSPTNSEKP